MAEPSIVLAKLDDNKLKESIDSLVTHLDNRLNDMKKLTTNAVNDMQKTLQSLGNVKVDTGGSADGGASKRAKIQNAETDAIEKNVAARDKQIKKNQETEMSFDQMAAALDKARQTVRDFNIGRQGGLPSVDDYKRYEQALARIVEYNDKLKQSALGMAFSNEKAFSFDAKRNIKDMFAVDDRLKQLNKYYTEQEKLSQKATQDEERQRQKRVAAMEKESAAQKKIIDDQYKLSFARTMKIPTDQLDLAQAKLERLQALLRDMRERGILSNTQIASTESEIRKLEQTIGQINVAQQQTTQSAQRYTEQTEKENRALQEQKEHLERIKDIAVQARKDIGQYGFANITNYRGVVYAENDARSKGLTIEQQIEKIIQEENAARNTQLGTERQITQEVEKRGKKYVSPTINDDAYQAVRNAIANKLGIDTSKVINADAQYDSIKRVSSALKQLQDAYARMTNEERNSPIGTQMIRQMQELQRQSQQLRAQMSRPISLKDALGGSEKTLDDIAYKMQRLRAYKQGIDLTKPNATNEIKQVDEALAKLQKDADKWMGKSNEMIKSNTALGRSWNYMKNRLAFYFTVGASTQFVKSLIDIRGQYEMLERSIGILFDSMQTGTKIFAELNAMAIKSPFTTMELGAAAKQLSAYNIAAKDVVDTTRRLADIAAAVGVPIERLTYALGQIKSYGYLNSRDARMFANAGIPLIQNLADMYTKLEGRLVSIGDVYDRIKKKQISFEDTIKVINEMTDEGGRFFNFQEKSADTLKVKLANLNLAYNNFLNELGKSEQGLLNGFLSTAKNMLDAWRNVDAILKTAALTLGILKTYQFFVLLFAQKYTAQLALQQVIGKKLAATMIMFSNAFLTRISNPYTWIAGALVYLGYLGVKLHQIKKDNEEFNKSISNGAKENIESIDKFIREYGRDIENVNSLNVTDQTKLWERVREEIEKTSKNAKAYIELLESIPNIAERVTSASFFFEQEKRIQNEAKRLADLGMFKIGGGYGDEPLANNLVQYENELNKVIRLYGDMDTAIKKSAIYKKSGQDQFSPLEYLRTSTMEAEKELNNFVAILDKADINRIVGNAESNEEAMAYIRDFSNLIRDNFLATEVGQKVSTQGQARLNAALDEWIATKGKSLGLLEEEKFAVEANRTAWEQFFGYFSSEDKKIVDYLIATHRTGSVEFQNIWDKAAKQMSNNATSAYLQIQQQITDLRNTPDIVINLVYRNAKEKLDPQQEEFVEKWITPKRWLERDLSTEQFLEEQDKNRTKYGRLMRKQDEDNYEWEKRLGQEYQENAKAIKSLNDQLKDYDKLSQKEKENADENMKKKASERDGYKSLNEAITDVGKAEHFNYEQFKKGGKNKKDILGEAFKDEVEIIQNIQKRYKEYRKEGVSAQDAISKATDEYGKTLIRVNSTLNKYGVKTKKSDELANMDMRSLRSYYMSLLNMASALGNAKGVEALEKAIAGLNVEITKVDYKTILDGLNNQLNKLKEEYELGIELDANPELGDMFAGLFSLDRSTMPKDVYDYVNRIQEAVNKAIKESDNKLNTFDILKVDVSKWATDSGVDVGSSLYKNVETAQKQARSAMKSYVTDVNKQTKDLQYKLADTNGKIAIEEEKLAKLQQQLGNETHDEKKRLLELQIQEEENTIDKLKEEVLQLLPTYVNLFNSIAEHSDAVTRKLALQWKKALENAVPNGNKYTVTDPISGQQSTISKEQLGKQLDKVNQKLRSTQTSFNKIRESLTKGEDGIVDWAKGIEQISDELKKMSELTSVIGDIAEALGNKNDFNETAEVLHDIANTMAGIAEAGDGIAKISAGDYIGGTTSLLKGTWTAISSWLDNDNKKIDAQIKSSERAVKRLELAYIDLEHAINDAYGVATIGAKRAAIANKELQLVELKRQLTLEQSRDSKDRDDDRIIELQKEIKELQYDIKEATDEIVNDLLGISSVGDAMESMMDNFIEALRNGEDAMKVFDESVNDMIANMVKKMYVTKILQPWFENAWNQVQEDVENRTKGLITLVNNLMNSMGVDDPEGAILKSLEGIDYDPKEWIESLRALRFISEDIYSQIDTSSVESIAKSMANLYKSGGITLDDIKRYASILRDGRDAIGLEMKGLEDFLRELDLMNDPTKELSALQQGIQGITEDTAGAIEAYLNGVSQQVYLHSDLLTQIRDTVVSFDFDVQLGVMSQMLMHLQNSYQTQQAIQRILEGVLTPSGRAFAVEMN